MKCQDCKNYEPEAMTKVMVWSKTGMVIGGLVKQTELYEVEQYSFSGTPDIDRITEETKLGKKDGALAVKIECSKPHEFNRDEFNIDNRCHTSILLWDANLNLAYWYFKAHKAWYLDEGKFHSDSDIEQAITQYLSKQVTVAEGTCPQCGELLVFPRGDTPYCEDCGYPDEDYAKQEIKVGDIVFGDDGTPCMVKNKYGDSIKIVSPDGYESRLCFSKNILRKATPDEVLDWFTGEVEGNLFVAYDMGNTVTKLYCMYSGTEPKILSTKYEKCSPVILQFIKDHNITPIPYEWAQGLWGDVRPYPKGE